MMKRKSNIELLRIIAMVMIVGHHYAVHGVLHKLTGGGGYIEGSLPNKILVCLLEPGGTVGVAVFFMITGFFLINRKEASPQKVIEETIYYGIICALAGVGVKLLAHEEISWGNILKTATVSATNGGVWWFATAYVFLLMLVPYINKYATGCSLIEYKKMLAIIWIFPYSGDILFSGLYTSVSKAILFYLIGGFIRRFKERIKIPPKICLAILVGGWISNSAVSFLEYEGMIGKLGDIINESLFTCVTACALFILFCNLDLSNKYINKISSTMYGVYLISDSIVLREFIWNNIWRVNLQYKQSNFALLAMISIVGTIVVCGLIDYTRILFIEPWLRKTIPPKYICQ